jgi:TRAP-type C4-dicarboxylate transport system permease small subunit
MNCMYMEVYERCLACCSVLCTIHFTNAGRTYVSRMRRHRSAAHAIGLHANTISCRVGLLTACVAALLNLVHLINAYGRCVVASC